MNECEHRTWEKW